MLEAYFESPFTLDRLRKGPSGAWLDGFAEALQQDGYSWWTARCYLRSADHLGHFLQLQGTQTIELKPESVVSFRAHRGRCRCPRPNGGVTDGTVRGARCFAKHLWSTGVASGPPEQPSPAMVQGFRHWLQQHRGVSERTATVYGEAAAELLREVGADPSQYDAGQVRSFLISRARKRGVGGTKAICSGLRLFLRYLAAQGQCRAGLDAAVPALAGWRLATLPRCLSPDEIERLLTVCDLTSTMGCRDRAVILLLARLGLRASDLATLRLTDIDWEDGSILVQGKTRRQARLPLPQEVGDALVAYLERRPSASDSHVFLRIVAPFRGLPASSISQIVGRVMRRAGVDSPSYGAHILRHSAATEMLRSGASLYEIGSVLRHQSLDMSAYYAKVDMELLKQVAQPWPEVLSC